MASAILKFFGIDPSKIKGFEDEKNKKNRYWVEIPNDEKIWGPEIRELRGEGAPTALVSRWEKEEARKREVASKKYVVQKNDEKNTMAVPVGEWINVLMQTRMKRIQSLRNAFSIGDFLENDRDLSKAAILLHKAIAKENKSSGLKAPKTRQAKDLNNPDAPLKYWETSTAFMKAFKKAIQNISPEKLKDNAPVSDLLEALKMKKELGGVVEQKDRQVVLKRLMQLEIVLLGESKIGKETDPKKVHALIEALNKAKEEYRMYRDNLAAYGALPGFQNDPLSVQIRNQIKRLDAMKTEKTDVLQVQVSKELAQKFMRALPPVPPPKKDKSTLQTRVQTGLQTRRNIFHCIYFGL